MVKIQGVVPGRVPSEQDRRRPVLRFSLQESEVEEHLLTKTRSDALGLTSH